MSSPKKAPRERGDAPRLRRVKRRPIVDWFDGCLMAFIGSWIFVGGCVAPYMDDLDPPSEPISGGEIAMIIGLTMMLCGTMIARRKWSQK